MHKDGYHYRQAPHHHSQHVQNGHHFIEMASAGNGLQNYPEVGQHINSTQEANSALTRSFAHRRDIGLIFIHQTLYNHMSPKAPPPGLGEASSHVSRKDTNRESSREDAASGIAWTNLREIHCLLVAKSSRKCSGRMPDGQGADKVLKSNSKAVPDEGKDGVLSMLTSVLSSSGAKEEAKKPVKQNSKVLPKKSIREALPPSPYCEAEVRDFLIATKLECKKLFNNYKRTKVVAGNNRTTRYFTCTLVLDTWRISPNSQHAHELWKECVAMGPMKSGMMPEEIMELIFGDKQPEASECAKNHVVHISRPAMTHMFCLCSDQRIGVSLICSLV